MMESDKEGLIAESNSPKSSNSQENECASEEESDDATSNSAAEPPPPSYSSLSTTKASVTCQVCGRVLRFAAGLLETVHCVKCSYCKETTSIKQPAPGKKYVRCSCNCLIVCNADAKAILCPRSNCGKIISIAVTSSNTIVVQAASVSTSSSDNIQVTCAYCESTFYFNEKAYLMARCPQCRVVSSVGNYARKRGTLFMVLGVALLVLCVALMAVAFAFHRDEGGWLSGPLIIAFGLIWMGIRLLRIKRSMPQQTV